MLSPESPKAALIRQYKNGRVHVMLQRLKERRQKRRNAISFVIGLVLNIVGSGIGYLKCEIDRELVDMAIDKKLEGYGLIPNNTNSENLEAKNSTESAPKKSMKVPSIVLVLMTTFGRIFNVIGTIKMFQACASFISLRRRKNLRTTTERMSAGEGENEWGDAVAECFTFCAV
ncbi:hypothetical protein FO519_000421 [Halicephalobus sp. NKZ332]|nr:hypothetical protein FO519_000421 [Halicephalobus sp. NKZ332]